jgi:predicted nucleotidyltransferase component of viral defense system
MIMLTNPPNPQNLRLLSSKFRTSPTFLEKDWYTQYILDVIANNCNSDQFQLVFGGGTSLSKGYRIIQRFSEDIDFKVQPLQPNLSRSQRSAYQDEIVQNILSSAPEIALDGEIRKRDRSTFLQFNILYPTQYPPDQALRTSIKIEITFETPKLPPQMLSLSSLIAQFQQQPAEIGSFPCVSLAETAADKIAAFTWRIFDRSPDDPYYDPRTIRHLHDLAYLADQVVNDSNWIFLATTAVTTDLELRSNNIPASNKKAPDLLTGMIPRLTTMPLYQKHYEDFVQVLSYDPSPQSYTQAIKNLEKLITKLLI